MTTPASDAERSKREGDFKGTPDEFWDALMLAYCDLFITWDEAIVGYHKYRREYDAAKRNEPKRMKP